MCDKKSFGDTELGQLLGAALIILSICLGVGGCLCLAGSDAKNGRCNKHEDYIFIGIYNNLRVQWGTMLVGLGNIIVGVKL